MKKGFFYLMLSVAVVACHMELPPNPVADFSFPAEKCEAPCVMTFTSTSQNADLYEWDFDDNNTTATGRQVTYKFESGRTYYVKLVAKSEAGGSSGITKTVVIDEKPESKPVAKFRFEPVGDIFVGDRVSFFNQSENSKRVDWNFGDTDTPSNPNTSIDERPSHLYSIAKSYSVTMIAYNSKGDQSPAYATIVVRSKPVKADFDVSTESCTAPCEVTFINKSLNATDFQWDFDDNRVSLDKDPGKILFSKPGTYHVKLTATGPGGQDGPVTKTITIRPGEFSAIAITGTGDFWGNDIIADAAGNVYVCGFVSGEADFGNGIVRSTNSNSKDLFVAKYDKGGQCAWAQVVGGPSWDEAHKITLDHAGSVYISGDTDGGINTSFSPQSFGGRDGFIAKLNPADGAFQWFNTIGGPLDDAVYGLAYSSSNDRLYLTGKVTGNGINFNGTLHNAVGQDIFFVFVNPATGEVRQPTIIGGPGDQVGNALIADADGNAYLTGYFTTGLTFPASHGVPSLITMGEMDGFVAKWVVNPGKWLWAGQMASSAHDTGDDIVLDKDQNAYITGSHAGYMTKLGVGTVGDFNVFVTRWRADGEKSAWARNGVNNGSTDYAGGITMTSAGNLVVHGTFTNSGQFPFNENNVLNGAGGMDVFVSEIETNGGHSTGYPSVSGGGSGTDRAKAICSSSDGHIYSIGSFSGTATFNGVTLTSKSRVNEGMNIFIAKWK